MPLHVSSVARHVSTAGLVQLSSWFRLSYATVLAVMLAPVLDAVRMVEAGAASGADVHHALSRFYDGWELGLILFAIHLLLLGWALNIRWLTGIEHDSGIVYLPGGRKYVLVILSGMRSALPIRDLNVWFTPSKMPRQLL